MVRKQDEVRRIGGVLVWSFFVLLDSIPSQGIFILVHPTFLLTCSFLLFFFWKDPVYDIKQKKVSPTAWIFNLNRDDSFVDLRSKQSSIDC